MFPRLPQLIRFVSLSLSDFFQWGSRQREMRS